MATALRGDGMRPLTGILLVVLAGTLFFAWFFTMHEKVESEIYVGFQGEARANDHYAAMMLLHELGIDAESWSSITPTEWLPDTNDTLFMRLSEPMAIGEQKNALLNWVSNGGHLVLLPTVVQSQVIDDFLAEFDLELVVPVVLPDAAEPASNNDEPAAEDVESRDFDDTYTLSERYAENHIEITEPGAPAAVIVHQGETIVARREYGNGFVTLVAEDYLFTNHFLDENDNARLFADIVVGELESGKVWIVYRSAFVPLWRVIWRAAPYLVATLALLLVLWIWHALPGFGPKIRLEGGERRSIIEHIMASGLFAWRRRGADNLYRSATQALLHDADAKHPGLTRLSAEKQAASIARITGMPVEKVMDALGGLADGRQRDFTHSMQKLQTIRKEL